MIRIYILLILVVLISFWLRAIFKKQNIFIKSKRKPIEFKEENEDLEKLRVVTNQLIEIEKLYQKTEIEPYLEIVIDLQTEVLKIIYENPKNLSENAKRVILRYANSLVNILQQWLDLKKKIPIPDLVKQGNERVISLLKKWQEILQSIRLKLLNNQYELLDAEIQALIDGLNLDK